MRSVNHGRRKQVADESKRLSLFWKTLLGFVVVLPFLGAIPQTSADDNLQLEKLSFCGNAEDRDASRKLLYVSTLDGSLTALDLENNGQLVWSLKTGPDPLLSSSIHRFELTNNGQMVRMIPSLYGGLYKFDGEAIEQIPITADHLLSSSYKFSDDLVISGGKETRSYGISARTGKVVYECSMNGCKNTTELDATDVERHGPPREYNIAEDREHDPMVDDIVVVRRETQTVRAIEPRTGGERWNFSVGHHELEILKPHDCHDRTSSKLDQTLSNLQLKVIVPDGIVCAVKKNDPNVVLWQYKFEHPIVNAWKTNKEDKLEPVNLFSFFQFPVKMTTSSKVEPSVYVGMYNKQLYIQESDSMKKIQLDHHLDAMNRNYLSIPWKPFPAKNALSLIGVVQEGRHEETALEVFDQEETSVTAMSVLYATEYANGNGFYLYTTSDLNRTSHCDRENVTKEPIDADDPFDFPFADDDTPTKIIIVSLWYWWKEIMVISLTTALILNVVLSRRITNSREVVIVERHVEIQVPVPAEPIDEESASSKRTNSESQQSDTVPFVSRYQTDFDMVRCLGKGGFGVVFESKNKLDDCKYAIKRIVLPSRQESRERVMREVKTLAHCEHQNIVRYFQAWVEQPPPGWQERNDRLWMDNEALSHSIDIDSPSGETSQQTTTRSHAEKVFSKAINRNDRGLEPWIKDLNTNECINFDDNNRKTSFVNDDSYVQFIDDECDDCLEDSVSVFSDKYSTRNDHSASVDIIFKNEKRFNTNDSFQIEFQRSTSGRDSVSHDRSSAVDSDDEQDDDSFQIEFKSDSKVSDTTRNDDSYSIEFKNSTNGHLPAQSNGVKQRTYSETNTASHAQSHNGDDNVFDSNSRAVEPFKKTHRRPLSLDLTANRRKVEVFNNTRMYLYIQMQLCKKQSLKDWLRLNDLQTRQRDIVSIFKQIVDGVEYCHLKGLIHRDLKPGNIFFSMDGQIKIGDFGLVTGMTEIPNTPCSQRVGRGMCAKHTQQVGTQLYMSPEQTDGLQYNYKVDIYSLGLIFFELLVVFGTEMERIQTLKALRSSIFPKEFSYSFPNEYDLLKLMLSQSPDDRPTTIGIRARPPLGFPLNPASDSEWHFELPPRRRDSQLSGINLNGNGSVGDSGHSSK